MKYGFDYSFDGTSFYLCFATIAVSKGMRAVKLCTSKIHQFLTGGAN